MTLIITETHLDKNILNKQIHIDNYKLVRRDRTSGSGGGCIFYVADYVNIQHLKHLYVNDVEAKVNTGKTTLVMGAVYRSQSDNGFFTSFLQPLEKIWLKYQNIIVLGDLNCM